MYKRQVYRYANGLSRYRSFSYGRGLEATSAAFLKEDDARLAVLVSSIEESGEGESEKTYTRAERVMPYDSRLNVAGEIPLEGELCTALGAEEDVYKRQGIDGKMRIVRAISVREPFDCACTGAVFPAESTEYCGGEKAAERERAI